MSAQLSNPYYLETYNYPDSTLQGLVSRQRASSSTLPLLPRPQR